MNKVLVKLYVPMIGAEYDIWIPINKKIHTITKLLVKVVYEFSDGCYKPEQMPGLYDKKTASRYDVNAKVIDTEIRNGTELVLI